MTNVSILYPVSSIRLSCIGGYKMGTLAGNRLANMHKLIVSNIWRTRYTDTQQVLTISSLLFPSSYPNLIKLIHSLHQIPTFKEKFIWKWSLDQILFLLRKTNSKNFFQWQNVSFVRRYRLFCEISGFFHGSSVLYGSYFRK